MQAPEKPYTLKPDPEMMALHDLYDKHEYVPILEHSYIHRCKSCGDLVLVGMDGRIYGQIHDFFIQEYMDIRVSAHHLTYEQANKEIADCLRARALAATIHT